MDVLATWVYLFELAYLSRNNTVFEGRGVLFGLFGGYYDSLVIEQMGMHKGTRSKADGGSGGAKQYNRQYIQQI